MAVQALGYMGVRSKSLEDWADFGTRHLGLQLIDKSRSTLAFRMDDRKQRIVVDQSAGEGVNFFGWEVADRPALDALAGRLEDAGVKVATGGHALADERHVTDLIVLNDPIGNRVEVFHGAEKSSDPFLPGRSISGFRTGALGLGHVVFGVESADAVHSMLPFYRDLLGFRLTDYYSHPFEARFLHVNQRHHSLAFVEMGKNMFHHLMMELFSLDDVGQGYDLAIAEDKVATTLGRHTSDYMTSFYSETPSQFMIEYGWGCRLIEPATWQPQERNSGPSLWGHERTWTSDETAKRARELKRKNAENGLRAPVQVLDGNFEVMPGACPWWDSVKAGAAPSKSLTPYADDGSSGTSVKVTAVAS
jgi:2,3-dihydroxybiphenyl 1,2-dioxygenase